MCRYRLEGERAPQWLDEPEGKAPGRVGEWGWVSEQGWQDRRWLSCIEVEPYATTQGW